MARLGRRSCQTSQTGFALCFSELDRRCWHLRVARAVEGELPDPNLHWHVVLLNLLTREDGTTGALDARALFRPHMKMALGALFRAELSKELGLLA